MAPTSNTPYFDSMARLSTLRARFFMPGHKGNPAAIPLLGDVLRYDMTEVEGADDLSHPSGALLQSQANMAKACGSGATLYSAQGSTGCIQAMLTLFTKPGGPVILARGCHAAAVRALVFLDARPLWLPTQNGRLTPEILAPCLEKYPGAPVYLTSPDYYGRMADIPALSALCRRHGSPLLVDNAHGAYLPFVHPARHPLHLGADATADSAHKTLPCLTGAALLHLKDPALAAPAREALNLYTSTSPNFLILQSLDLCAGLLLTNPPDFDAAAARLAAACAKTPHLVEACDEPLKLCLLPPKGGWPAEEVLAALAEAGILPEYEDGTRIVLMAGPYNREEDFALLEEVLAAFPPKDPLPYGEPPMALPEVKLPPREAYFAPREKIPVQQAAGRVAASIDAPCPPGVPLVVPGEVLTKKEAALLAAGGILRVDVVK